MKILNRYTLGKNGTHCYIINHNNKIILIDAPPGIEVVAKYLDDNNLKIDLIYLTHTHFDHIIGLEYLVENNYIDSKKIYCPEEEIFALKDPKRTGNLSMLIYKQPFVFDHPVSSLNDLKDEDIEIRYLKGHSIQSAIYIFKKDKIIFGGDVLFDEEQQSKYYIFIPNVTVPEFIKQIKEKVLTLPDDYMVYAGHLSDKTIGQRKSEERFK